MSRRLDTNVSHISEHDRLEAEARLYGKIRRDYIQWRAGTYQLVLSVMDVENIYDKANGVSQGIYDIFKLAADTEIQDFLRLNPDKVRYSALSDWMNDEMTEMDKARREIASWDSNPKIAYFDTETTGLDDTNVPFSAAACNCDGKPLCAVQMLTLDSKGELITISPEASRVTGVSMAVINQYMALEDDEHAICDLENLMFEGYILTGYNTQFDRGMICRALLNASERVARKTGDKFFNPQEKGMVDRLAALHRYYTNPAHWLETKDVFVRAIGLDPDTTPGRRTRLQDVARATRALQDGENQEHGALADCQLLARIVRNIRKELENMPTKTPKTAPVAKQTEEIQTEPETPELYTNELKDYVAGLEKSLGELQENYNLVNEERVRLGNRIRELENLCEQYQQDETIKHHEARELTWCDLEINGYKFNWTIREGETVEAAVEAAFRTVRALQTIKASENVKLFRVGLRDSWTPLKGFEKPEQPTHEQPAQPKSNGNQPPAANRPAPAKPATPPQQQQPAQGKTTGEKKSQLCGQIVRHDVDGKNMFDLLYTLSNGKPSDYPLVPSKKDTPTLEKAILEAGYEIASLEPGETYDLPILVEWTVGDQIPKSDPPKFYRNNMTFTVQTGDPF